MREPSRWRLVATALFLPSLIACADQLALGLVHASRWAWLPTLFMFVLLVAQSFMLSYFVGRWLPNWHWRLGVLGWAVVLVNVSLLQVSFDAGDAGQFWGTNVGELLTRGFVSAQVSAAIIWLILGAAPLEKRLLVTAGGLLPCLGTLLISLVHSSAQRGHEVWNAVICVQLMTTLGFSTLMCALHWQIVDVAKIPAKQRGGQLLQFSVRQLFIATTAAAVITFTGNAIARRAGDGSDLAEGLHVATDGVLLALLLLAAVWSALGSGHGAIRLLVLLALAVVAGGLSWGIDTITQAMWIPRGRPMTGFGWRARQLMAGPWWMGWTILVGAFLASWLSVLRAAGYRLIRGKIR
jgi:hypothetical protein